MPLADAVYAELEQIVGAEHISDKPHVLAGNRQPMPSSAIKPPSPVAVIVPATTDEVARIVRVCVRNGLRVIPVVSSLISFAYPSGPDTVILHLKRMNHIEFDETDRMVVVGPGIRHGQLKTEVMRRGLSYPVAAVGPGGSVLANFACASGDSHNQNGASRTNRYLLGIEWVTPEGEVLKLGSLATGSGWFCADGPGPSLRGLIKGYSGGMGSFGVVTRIAIGLDPWKGPRQMPCEGRSPNYRIALPRETNRAFIFKFPSHDAVRDAMLEIGKAEIGTAVLKYFNCTAALLCTTSANAFHDLWDSGLFQRELDKPLYVYLSTHTAREMNYQIQVLEDIVGECGGLPVDPAIQRIYDDNMDFFMLVGFLQRVLRLGGAWAPNKLGADSIHHMFDVGKHIADYFPPMLEQGLFFDAPDNWQVIPMEYGHMAHIEHLYLWDRAHPMFAQLPMLLGAASFESDVRHGHHASVPPPRGPMLAKVGALFSNHHIWLDAVRVALGANRAG